MQFNPLTQRAWITTALYKSSMAQNWINECVESRSTLFYQQWPWSVSWPQPEITALRDSLDQERVNYLFDRRRSWEKSRWETYSGPSHGLRPSYRSVITPEVQHNVHTVRKWLLAHNSVQKTVYYQGYIHLYMADRAVVDSAVNMCQEFVNGPITIKHAVIDVPPNTIVLKKPHAYSLRTFVKSMSLPAAAMVNIGQWAEGMADSVRVSASFAEFLRGHRRTWLARNATWTFDHYFVDHNDHRLTAWLNMLAPGIVRKTVAIQSPAK